MTEQSAIRARIEVIDDAMAEVLRSKSGAERWRIANGLFRFAQTMIRSSLRSAHPEWDDVQIDRETARRISHGTVGTTAARR